MSDAIEHLVRSDPRIVVGIDSARCSEVYDWSSERITMDTKNAYLPDYNLEKSFQCFLLDRTRS